jgi:hypothetical protein
MNTDCIWSKLKGGEQGLSSGHGVDDYLIPRMKIYETRVGGSGYKELEYGHWIVQLQEKYVN